MPRRLPSIPYFAAEMPTYLFLPPRKAYSDAILRRHAQLTSNSTVEPFGYSHSSESKLLSFMPLSIFLDAAL